jgi:hypothetical protein
LSSYSQERATENEKTAKHEIEPLRIGIENEEALAMAPNRSFPPTGFNLAASFAPGYGSEEAIVLLCGVLFGFSEPGTDCSGSIVTRRKGPARN